MYYRLSNWSRAIDYYKQAQEIFIETGNQRREATLLNNFGMAHYLLGDHAQAEQYLIKRLDIHRQLGNREGEAQALNNLGAKDS